MPRVNGQPTRSSTTPTKPKGGQKGPKERGVPAPEVHPHFTTDAQLEAGLVMEAHFDASLIGVSFPYKGGGINLAFHIPEESKWLAAHLVDRKGLALHLVIFRPPLYDEMSEYGDEYIGDGILVQREDFDQDYKR